MPNRRMKARGRPQRRQRLYARTANFGLRLCFSMRHFLAIGLLLYFVKGMPSSVNNWRASESALAVVVKEMVIPLILSILS